MADSDSPVPVDKTDVNAPGVRGSTALVDAAARGNVNSLQILLQSKSIDVNQPSKYGYVGTPRGVAPREPLPREPLHEGRSTVVTPRWSTPRGGVANLFNT